MAKAVQDRLGALPEGWVWRPLRHIAKVRNSNVDKLRKPGERAVRLCNYVDVYRSERIHLGLDFMRATATEAEVAAFRLKRGDVLITKDSEAWNDIGVPALVVDEADDLLCGYHLARLRPQENEVSGAFLCYALQVPAVANQLHLAARGVTRYGLSQSGIKSATLPIPPMGDQGLIVRYLDNAELRIGKALQAKQEMANLMREREQQDLIAAITGGAGALLVDPRVDWLPGIPAHWEVKRLGSVLKERGEQNKPIRVQQVLSLLRKKGVIPYEEKGNIGNKKSEDISRYKIVRTGDIVVNCMNVIIGSSGLSGYEGCLSPVYYVLHPRNRADSAEYFAALFQLERFHKSLVRFGRGILAHRMRVSMLDLKTVLLPVPPPDEQVHIVERVRLARAATDAAIAATEREMELLREYRIRLISDVVTGEKDVRAEAASMKDVDSAELAAVLAGATASDGEDIGEDDDAE